MTGHLGLGGNLGDRRATLQRAVGELALRDVVTVASSSVYETDPVGEVTEQPDFLNACVEIRTDLDPAQLLAACREVERLLGRTQSGQPGYVRHGPRPIDIDILLLGDHVVAAPDLVVPHPALAERRFVLIPLLELDLGLMLPGDGGTLAQALARLPQDEDVRWAGPPLRLPGAAS